MIAAHNSPYHLLTYIACAGLGAVFVPVSYRLTHYELQGLVDFVAPRAIICDSETASRGGFVTTGTLLQFVIDDDVHAGPLSDALHNGYLGLTSAFAPFDGSLVAESGEAAEDAQVDVVNARRYPQGLAAIFFTSGSAGAPKAVQLTHANLWWGAQNFREGFEYRTDDTVIAVAPMSHIGGFNGTTLDVFSHGGHVVVIRSFNAGVVLRAIENHRASIMFGVPTMYAALLNHPDCATRDLRSWRLPLIGGSPVPAPMLGMLASLGLHPLSVWGMTETSGSGSFLPFEHCAQMPGSAGRPFAYIEARVMEPGTATPVPHGTVGELAVRGPSVTDGYWHGAEYTKEAIRGGWFLTGDLAQVTSNGYISISGRLADRIITGGEGVMPSEVEDVLRQYPGVVDAVVCGIPDDLWGERIVAGVVMEAEAAMPSLTDVQAFAASVLSRFKLPRYLVQMSEIPVNSANKVDRGAFARAIWKQLFPAESGTTENS